MSCNHTIRENPEYIEYQFKTVGKDSFFRIKKNIPCSSCKKLYATFVL